MIPFILHSRKGKTRTENTSMLAREQGIGSEVEHLMKKGQREFLRDDKIAPYLYI